MKHTQEQLKQIIYNDIYTMVKNHNMKSVTINQEVYDYRNIPREITKKDIIHISKKYIPLLQHYKLSDLNQFLPNEYNLMLINKRNKFIGIKVTHHSAFVFIKRFMYVFLMNTKAFELSNEYSNKFLSYFNKFYDIYETGEKELGDNKDIIECMNLLLNDSGYFDFKSTGRLRDKIAFKDRKNVNTSRYFTHPFLFIVEREILQTVELYSSSYDFRSANRFIKDEIKYKTWLDTKVKGKI